MVQVGDVVWVTGFLPDEESHPVQQWLLAHPATVLRVWGDAGDAVSVTAPLDLGAWVYDPNRPAMGAWTVSTVRPASPEELAAYQLGQLAEGGL
jgi:hypothetical protein